MRTGHTFEIKVFFSLFIFLQTKIKSGEISYHALCTFCLIFFPIMISFNITHQNGLGISHTNLKLPSNFEYRGKYN